jgi:hypothetical protein
MAKSASVGPTLLFLAAIACGCSPVRRHESSRPTPPRALVIDEDELSKCLSPRARNEVTPGPAPETPKPAPMLAELPPELRRVVAAARVEPLLAALLQPDPSDGSDPVAIKMQLVMQVSSLEIAVSSLLFETACHGAQMDAMLRELDRRKQMRDVGLTVSSILVGMITSTAGGIWEAEAGDEGAGPAALLIGGGVASATLGLAVFIPDRRAVVFRHQPNLLAPIVHGEDPEHLYPSFVFRMLLSPNDAGTTIRDEILAEWEQLLDENVSARDRALAEALLHGDGGIYDQRLLEVRERMFDALESHIHAIDQELELLYRYSARAFDLDGE